MFETVQGQALTLSFHTESFRCARRSGTSLLFWFGAWSHQQVETALQMEAPNFQAFDSSCFCADGGWKVGSVPAFAGHTFQFISSVTFLIADKLINYAAGALKTPMVTLPCRKHKSPPDSRHNGGPQFQSESLGSEWLNFLGVLCWLIFLEARGTVFREGRRSVWLLKTH